MLPNLSGGQGNHLPPFPFPPGLRLRLGLGPATPVRVRLSWAIAASIALHAAILVAVHPSRGVSRAHEPALTARLVSADERRDQPLRERTLSVPAQGGPAEQAAESPQEAASLALPAPPALAEPRYYLASELHQQPAPLQPVEPEAPPESGIREGFVQLRLLINESGSVDEVTVVRAEPVGVYEKSALAAFANAKFSPGMRFGAAVKSQLLVEVQYRLDKRDVSGRGY
jgi:TonB family protein